MDWLTDWDDLIHGTAVFSAAVPFLLALLLSAKAPLRLWWLVLPGALVGSVYWLFDLPQFPPKTSEDVVMTGLLAAVAVIGIEFALARRLKWPARALLRLLAFVALAWSVYPAWLAMEGELSRKWLVCGGIGVSVTLWSMLVEIPSSRLGARTCFLTPAALIPPTISLAILLQTGGSIRFGQATGALAAALGALCFISLFRFKRKTGDGGASTHPNDKGLGRIAGIWAMLFVLLAWSGWLFAEIRYGLAALLLCAPLAALLINCIPILPRKNYFLTMLWDFLASGAVSLPIAINAWSQYAAEMAEFEGY